MVATSLGMTTGQQRQSLFVVDDDDVEVPLLLLPLEVEAEPLPDDPALSPAPVLSPDPVLSADPALSAALDSPPSLAAEALGLLLFDG